MHTPPPIAEEPPNQYSRPPQNNTLKIVLWISGGCLVMFCIAVAAIAALMGPIMKQAQRSQTTGACLSNVKQQGMGMLMYSADWDDKMPMANGWMDNIAPYIRNEDILRCPDLPVGMHGYAYNDLLDNISNVAIAEPANCVMIYETSDLTRNSHGHTDTLPRPSRHNGNSICYSDGHAKKQPETWRPTMNQDPKKSIRP